MKFSPLQRFPRIVSSSANAAKVSVADVNGKVKEKKKDRFSSYFQERGLQAGDIPKAIIIHELLGFTMLFLTWSLCFLYPPSQSRLLKKPIERMMHLMPKALSNSVASNGFLNSRMGSSYIESSCLRKIIRPATFPMKLYVTYEIVCATRGLRFGFQSTAASNKEKIISKNNAVADYIYSEDAARRKPEDCPYVTSCPGDFTCRLLKGEKLF